ncbi:vWA domain-containing protein [Hugenholtzia roseola]|uniref:vWA domain-containing protein n=1 Tax=Hugenholtzia roseola TaxID=1002 RepID=UPI000426023A|nr:VWA domain-containing protein [Hugenholtzia roseola]
MLGYQFSQYVPRENNEKSDFERLLKIFLELLGMSGGNVAEAMAWLTNLDNKYQLTDEGYGIGDFFEDLKKKGFLEENPVAGSLSVTPKTGQQIRKNALNEIFGKIRKANAGNHRTAKYGNAGETEPDKRPFQYGDDLGQIAHTDSIRNAQINWGIDNFHLTENDLEVHEKLFLAQTSTVLMIDISHSMILYGEDRITPAKKVAMALAELITQRYPKDTLDVIVFGNDAWQIEIKDLPYLEVGPYHTNTVAGLELAMNLLRRRKNPNKQIFMITDGKPTCIKQGVRYYKNSFGLDKKILNKTLNLATQCKKLHIPITTFMIASDPYLQQFVREFSEANKGKAYFSGLSGLGQLVLEDFDKRRKKQF